MKKESIIVTQEQARRLFIYKQNLIGNGVSGNFHESVISLIRQIGYIQWDPVTVVAPSHMISLWSRIGNFQWKELYDLMWEEKDLFLHWTPIAILVLTEDYPVYYSLMKEYPESLGTSWRNHIERARHFLDTHRELRSQVINRLKDGPANMKDFNGYGVRRKSADGWSSGNEVTTLLYHLHMLGEVMVSGRSGNQNVWSLTADFLPEWAEKTHLPVDELERRTAVRGLKALGIATEFDINRYYVRGRYRNLKETIKSLYEESDIIKVQIEGGANWRQAFIHKDDVEILDRLDNMDWDSNLRLISPFDNIVTIRERAKRLFNFDYTLEQFVPREKRKYGTYVLPVLWQDTFVGRVDMKLDKANDTLEINSVHAEPGSEGDMDIPLNLDRCIKDFSKFIGAEKVRYSNRHPQGWDRYLAP